MISLTMLYSWRNDFLAKGVLLTLEYFDTPTTTSCDTSTPLSTAQLSNRVGKPALNFYRLILLILSPDSYLLIPHS